MYKTDCFISSEEIQQIVGISKSMAYSLIQELNGELEEKGYLTVPGRGSRNTFYYKIAPKNSRNCTNG